MLSCRRALVVLAQSRPAAAPTSGLRRTTPGITQQRRRTMANMPVPQSSQAKLFEGHNYHGDEGWEPYVKFWYSTSFVVICCILAGSPDTDIEAWASREAAARLALPDEPDGSRPVLQFGTHYQDLVETQTQHKWDVHMKKTIRMTDDEEEEEEETEDDDDE
jgi:hypothetical protein